MAETEWITTQSCLSSRVHHLLCTAGIIAAERNVVMYSGTLDWRAVNVLFDDAEVKGNSIAGITSSKMQPESQTWFEEVIGNLAPVFLHVQNVYQKISTEKFIKDHLINLHWTHNEKIFVRCYELLQNDGVDLVLAILLMTAAIERALGNVFLLKGKQVPSLLKDLLMTTELQEIFGILPVKLMQVMIGPPLSLNLRNLVWHGFVMPHEMHKRYGYFLLILVLSLGEQLSRNGVAPEDIPKRDNIDISCETRVFEGTFPDITDKDISEIQQIVSTSNIILPGFKVYWEIALLKYQQAEFGDFLTLILPQLESCLRVIYATVNCCPERILTAEVTSLYTTFEEILCLEDSNKVPIILGESYMELLLDLLVYPEGPRVRDHISHGEVDFCEVPKHLANHVLSVLVAILCKFQPKHLLPKNEYIQKVQQYSSTYWPYFHPKSLLKNKNTKFLKSLIAWETYPQPEEVNETKRNPAADTQNIMSQSIQLYCDYLNMENVFWSIDHGFDVNKMLEDVQNSFPKIAYQSKFEKEVINLLRHIISHASSASEQINATLHCRYKLWTDKQLRSRQRINYMRLLKSIPFIRQGLIFMGLLSLGYSVHINKLPLTSVDCKKTIKMLKMVLQYAENMNTLTNAERNRWEESCKLTTDILINFIQLLNAFNR